MADRLDEGRHSWNAGDHPRDGDGKFASTGGDTPASTPAGGYAGRRRTGGDSAPAVDSPARTSVETSSGSATATRNEDGSGTITLGNTSLALNSRDYPAFADEIGYLANVHYGRSRAAKQFTVGSQRPIPMPDGAHDTGGPPIAVVTRTGHDTFEMRLRPHDTATADETAATPGIPITARDAGKVEDALKKFQRDQVQAAKAAKAAARADNIRAGRANPADTARRATGTPPAPANSERRGMPDAVTSQDIPLAAGGTIAVHRPPGDNFIHVSTDGRAFALTSDELANLNDAIDEADDVGWDVGDSGKVTDDEGFTTATITKTGSREYEVQVDGKPAFTLAPKDAARIAKAATGMERATRVDTGNGAFDLIPDGRKVSIRQLGDDGRPVETTFNSRSWQQIQDAMSAAQDGFGEDSDEPVNHRDVKTNAGTVRVEVGGGAWGEPGSSLLITPVDDNEWGVAVDGPNMNRFYDAFANMLEAAVRPLDEYVPLSEALAGAATKGRFKVLLIRAGWGSSGYYSETVLRRDGPNIWPEGTHMYLNHPTPAESMDRPEGDVQNWASVTTSPPVWDPVERGLVADIQVFPQWRGLLNEEFAQRVGLSIRASGQVEYGEAEGREGPIVTSLDEGISVDWVTRAGAGGRVLQLIESARTEGELLRQAAEAKAPPFKKKDADDKADDQDKPDDAEDTEPDDEDDDLPSFLKKKIKAKAKVSEARNVGNWLESRLHKAFTEMADDMFGEGRLTRDERIALSSAIGEGLTAFNSKIADQMPHLYERDLWDDPSPARAADAAPENPAPTEVAESKNEPGSSPAVENEREVGMPELTEAQARELQEAHATAEADKTAALQKAATAEMALARFTALEAARPIATKVLAESGLPAGAQAKLLAAVTSERVPLTGENALDESALKTSVEEAAKAESTYLASLAEGEGAGQVRGLGESATASRAPDAATVTALEETYRSRGLSPEAARLAAVGRP